MRSSYQVIVSLHMLISSIVCPALSLLAWILVAKARSKKHSAHVSWLVPIAISQTLTAVAILLLTVAGFFASSTYAMALTAYSLNIVSMVFSVVAFVRLWRVISSLLSQPGQPLKPQVQEGVWPPPPQM